MADYIYTMESRLSPEQMRVVNLVQKIARIHGMNVYLTGGAIRDVLTGFPIRDLDFTVQGNPLKLQHEIEHAGGIVDMTDTSANVIHMVMSGIRAEISMARAEHFEKPGKPPVITPATINEDLRRRDFTCNAMALSLNDGSRGLLLDPFNGAADIEQRLLRVLHSYAFLEDPSRLIRATRFATRFGWELEEKTRARYDAAVEGEYIQFLNGRTIGYEIEQIALEENPIAAMKALEEQGWLKVLCAKWTVAKAEVPELAELLKTRSTMADLNIAVDAAPAVMQFLTLKLSEADVTAIQKQLPHREFVAAWKRLEDDARELSKKLQSKEAALNSGAWKILAAAKPEALLYLDVTGRNKTVDEKIKNFFGAWRQVQEQIPTAKMTELRITPQLPEYQNIWQEAFYLLLDGKLRNEEEIATFLAPFEPPLPPPPPAPVRRGRAAAKKAAPAAKAAPQEATHAAAAAANGTEAAVTVAAAAPAKPAAAKRATVEPVMAKPAAKAAAPAKKPSAAVVAKPAAVPAKAKALAAPAKAKPAQKKPVAKPAAKKAAKPAPKKAAKPAPKPVAKKAVKPAPKPPAKKQAAVKTVSKPAAKSAKAAKPVAKAVKAPEKKKEKDKKHNKHEKGGNKKKR